MAHVHAVLTGDLIDSRSASTEDVDAAMATLARTAHRISANAAGDTRFSRSRGDGWQLFLRHPGMMLTASVALVAALVESGKLRTRIAVGVGTVGRIGPADLSDATGEAFEVSGRLLALMPRGKSLAVAGPWVDPFHRALFDMADFQSSRWTKKQAEAIAFFMVPDLVREAADKPESQARIAEVLGISQQAVQARLAGAGYANLRPALDAFESHDWGRPA